MQKKPSAEPGYHSPSPVVWILATEATVLVDGVIMTALVDTRFQVSTLTEGFC